jgi:uncharacterized protein (TIRG00374 family)
MLHAICDANLLWVIAGIAAYGLVEVFGATRWQILLRVQGIYIPWYRLGALLMIGILFNPIMPGGTGGDVVKIFYLLKETPGKKAQALLAVLIDRVIGLLGLILIVSFIIWKKYDWLQQTQITKNLTWTLLAILAASLCGIVFSIAITSLNLAHKLPHKMPFRDKLIELSIAYNLYARAWKATLLALTVSIGVHVCSFFMFYSAAMALGAAVPMLNFFSVMPIINTISSLPISVGGTGVREGLFKALLMPLCNVSQEIAIGTSLLGFSMVLFWAVVGGIIYLFYRPTEHAKLSDIQHEVEELEHKVAESE